MWNLNFKRNETNETKQTNETQTILSVLCNAPCFAVRFFISQFVGWRVQFFAEMTC